MTVRPMFPLGSVLFPHMPLALRLFEPRYLQMLGQLLEEPEPAFGVVLIERGHEVGGGDHRFAVGTMAQILQVEALEGYVALVAQGTRRVVVREWLPDDPYPRADVEEMPDLQWDDGLGAHRDQAEYEVRRALSVASEYGDGWPADVALSEDPVAACWQLAAITPVGALDHVALLRADSLESLLGMTAEAARQAQESLRLGWPGL
jgi:Lon protease-like protein